MERSRLAIVIPAFNEGATIGMVVAAVLDYGVPIVVDDGSSDGTGELARDAGAEVVVHPANAGYDSALNSGFARAAELNCEYVVTMDADGQHDPSFLSAFVAELERGADVVVGMRDRRQRVAEHVFAFVSEALWGIRDPLCGLKGYRMRVYRELGHFDSFNSIGTELALYAARTGKKIAQFPIRTRERVGAPRFGRRFSANMRIFRALGHALI